MPRPIALVTSHGGHLDLLRTLRPAYEDLDRVWLTPPSPQADALRAAGERVVEVVNPWRSPALIARNAAGSLRFLRRERPRVVVSAGAGVAVAACVAARAQRVPLVFVETMARTENASASGRIAYRLATHFLVQWESLLRVYPRAELCRPGLLEGAREGPPPPGSGTFVAAGSHGAPFDRLVALVDDAAGAGALPEPVTVQGATRSYAPRHVAPLPELAPEVVRGAIAAAEVVITHGGSGVISQALAAGRVPLVLPRRAGHGEHFDDHQVGMARQLGVHGLVVSLDEHPLADALAIARRGVPPGVVDSFPGPPLADRLREIVHEVR